MSRSFGLVDEKLAEADFFLEKLEESGGNVFEAGCYFSAFVSASRTVTFAIQAAISDISGFAEWYEQKRARLRGDPLARFFHKARTESQHIGTNPIKSGSFEHDSTGTRRVRYFFVPFWGQTSADTPDLEVIEASRQYLTSIVELVYECYRVFGVHIDPEQYYTLANLQRLGLSVDDVEESLGLPRGYTDIGLSDRERLEVLHREIPSTAIDELFEKYLCRTRYDFINTAEREGGP